MRANYLKVLVFDLVQLIDQGKYAGITIEDVRQHIHAGDLLKWLGARFPENLRYSRDDEKQAGEVHEALERMVNAYGGDERKKWGIENSGICILIDWCIELLDEAEPSRSKGEAAVKPQPSDG